MRLNGQEIKFDVPPHIIGEKTMVPMRKMFDELNATVDWNGGTQTVTAVAADKSISLQIGNTQMTVNGSAVNLEVPPQIMNDQALVPIRAVSETFGLTVGWDEDTQTVLINTQ